MSGPRRVTSVLLSFGALAAVVACAVWGLAPLPAPEELSDLPSATASPATAPAEPRHAELLTLDLAVFRAPLWVAPPPPAKAVAAQPPPPPPPLRLQLVGIVLEEGSGRAVIYDPDSDVLHIVASGEAIGRCTVEGVTSSEVTLRDGEILRTLALREDLRSTGGAP